LDLHCSTDDKWRVKYSDEKINKQTERLTEVENSHKRKRGAVKHR
jgi:hypothetical protein